MYSSLEHEPSPAATAKAPVKMGRNDLERLPLELQFEIRDLLSFQDSIMLSQVNRHFNSIVRPQRWPEHEKAQFLLEAQAFERHDTYSYCGKCRNMVSITETVSYACFTCYRVKPMEAFCLSHVVRFTKEIQQLLAPKFNTRCCIDCGFARHRYKPGQVIRIRSRSREGSFEQIEVIRSFTKTTR